MKEVNTAEQIDKTLIGTLRENSDIIERIVSKVIRINNTISAKPAMEQAELSEPRCIKDEIEIQNTCLLEIDEEMNKMICDLGI